MKAKNKALSLILAAIMILTSVSALTIFAGAANVNEVEPNNTVSTANVVSTGDRVTGALSDAADIDYYSIVLDRAARLSVSVDFYCQTLTASVVNSVGTVLLNRTGTLSGAYGYLNGSIDLTAGTYYIVLKDSTNAGNYTLTPSVSNATENYTDYFGNTIRYYEPNNDPSQATSIPWKTTVNGQFALNDNIDVFKFTSIRSGEVIIDMNANVNNATLTILNDSRVVLKSKAITTEVYTIDLSTGTYYIQIEVPNGNTGTYSFDLSLDDSVMVSGGSGNNTQGTATTFSLSERIYGHVGVGEVGDYFKAYVNTTQTVTVLFETDADYATILVYKNSIGNSPVFSKTINSASPQVVATLTFEAGNTYYVEVNGNSAQGVFCTGQYAFCIKQAADLAVNAKFATPTTVNMYAGQSRNLGETVKSSPELNICWYVKDAAGKKVVMVSDTGVVTAIAPGTATIVAEVCRFKIGASVNDSSKYINVKCEIPIKVTYGSVTLNKSVIGLICPVCSPNGSPTASSLSATTVPSMGTVTFSSSDVSVATVNETTGRVSAVNCGTATITAKYECGLVTYVAYCTVNVDTVIRVSSVDIAKANTTIDAKNSETLAFSVNPSNATNPALTWTSSDNSIATVSNGVVVGVKAGTAIITATSVEDPTKSDTCVVTVKRNDFWSKIGGFFSIIWEAMKAIGRVFSQLLGGAA